MDVHARWNRPGVQAGRASARDAGCDGVPDLRCAAGYSGAFRTAALGQVRCDGLLDPSREELDEMAVEFGPHPLAVEDARKGHQRPKIEEYDDSAVFSVLEKGLERLL